MSASIASVVTRGYGVPGSAALVVTAGYGIGDALGSPDAEGVEWTLPDGRMHYTMAIGRQHWTIPDEH